MCIVYPGRVHTNGYSHSATPRAGYSRAPASRQLVDNDDVTTFVGDVTTSAASRRRQAERRRTSRVVATTNSRMYWPLQWLLLVARLKGN